MAAISKNVYFDVLDDIVNKYNITVHWTIKMKPSDVPSHSYTEYNEDSNETYLKLVTVSEYQNAKRFLLRDTSKVGPKRILLLVKLNIQFRGLRLLVT